MVTLARRSLFLAAGLTLLALSVSCNKGNQTVPSPTLMTEDKTGTVPFLGSGDVRNADVKTFSVNYLYSQTPSTITVKSLQSNATGANLAITIGVAFGTPAFDGSCTRASVATAAAAEVGKKYSTDYIFTAGNYCIAVYDAGTLTEATKYAITIEHY